MSSLRKKLLEKLVARRPMDALKLSAGHLGITALQIRLPETSTLYSANGGQFLELPLDGVMGPYVIENKLWQTEELEFIAGHLPSQPSVLIDVGANFGLITRQLLQRLPHLQAAVCFEPHPVNFRLLQRNLAHLTRWQAVQSAVGDRDGELRFYEDLANAGNYSLNPDAMRDRKFQTSIVKCVQATEANLLASLAPALRNLPLVWKSDTQGFDEIIVTSLPDSFWARVQVLAMELWCIERPAYSRERLGAILKQFEVRRFADDPGRNLTVEFILEFANSKDHRHGDLLLARK